MRTALIGTTLENRFEIMGLQLTTFKFTDDFTASIEDFSDKKNKIIGEQAILAQKRVIAEQARVQSAGERDAKKNRADGDAYEIRELGNATGDRLAAEVAPLANPGADNLLRLKQYEAWASGGAQVPDVLTMGGGSNGGGGPTMVFDGRNLLPLLDGQQQAPKAPGEEEGALEDGAAADETALVEPAAADAAPPPVKNFGPR